MSDQVSLALAVVALVVSLVSLTATIAQARMIDRRWPRPTPGCSCGFAGTMGGRDPQCPEHGQATDGLRLGESPYTSVSAAVDPVPEVPPAEWPQRAPDVRDLGRYGVQYRLDGRGWHRLTLDYRHGWHEGTAVTGSTYPEAWRTLLGLGSIARARRTEGE